MQRQRANSALPVDQLPVGRNIAPVQGLVRGEREPIWALQSAPKRTNALPREPEAGGPANVPLQPAALPIMFNKLAKILNISYHSPMGQIAEREQLVKSVIALRAAERHSPAGESLAMVRANLERMIGPTVTRAMAARLLNVSQTALDRWIDSGDVPVVMTRSGRQELPLHVLVAFVESVDERRRSGDPHPLASALNESHSRAERLDFRKLLPRRSRSGRDSSGHRRAELLGLVYHRAVAQRLDDQIVQEARRRLRQWRAEQHIDPRYAAKWEEILSRPTAQIAKLISRDDQRTRDLRQNSPFAGALSEPERERILEAVEEFAS